jgi:hypothetical protein
MEVEPAETLLVIKITTLRQAQCSALITQSLLDVTSTF